MIWLGSILGSVQLNYRVHIPRWWYSFSLFGLCKKKIILVEHE
jgi:hypothetical protein